MRAAFSDALVRLAVADPKVLLLTGDHGYALFDAFRKQCPSQYINAGIAEQNMVGMAAGLARLGFRPFVYGLAAFVPVRVLEQIKLDVAHDNLPVVFLGDGAGFVYSQLGTSHQSAEDIACTRAIPGLNVMSPADAFEMTACLDFAYGLSAPVYLRMGKSDRGNVHAGPVPESSLGRPIALRSGKPGGLAILATGSMVRTAIDIADGLSASVWSVPGIKPLPESAIIDCARDRSALIVMEEHSTLGGLGSAVAEILSQWAPIRVLRVGIEDRFSQHCGSYEYLLKEHRLDAESILQRIEAFCRATPT